MKESEFDAYVQEALTAVGAWVPNEHILVFLERCSANNLVVLEAFGFREHNGF
jgi:hypothetical protein